MPPLVIRSEEIAYRVDFALLANARGYKDAVEVGVDQGVFAREFLSRWHGHWLYLVDPYEPCEDFPYDRSGDLAMAAQALAPYHGRCRFVRTTSAEAAEWVTSLISPEFVYLDGAHDDVSVARDLMAWWPLIPEHGLIAGHDWDNDHPGVKRVVTRFAEKHGLVIRTTHETASPPSWYCYRREPETLMHRLFREGETANPLAASVRPATDAV